MTYPKSVASLAVAALLFGGAYLTDRRAALREAAALAAYPPTGQFVLVGGARVHVRIAGSGPDLILIHGASANLNDPAFALMDRLAPRFRVIAFDRPGLGYSDPIPSGATSLAAQARHLSAAAAQLGVSRPILLGQSYGGAVALAWAATLPDEPAALVLVSAASLPWPSKLDPWYQLTATAVGAAILVPLASAFVPPPHVDRLIADVFQPAPVPAGYGAAIGSALVMRRDTLRHNARLVNELRAELVALEPDYSALTLPVEIIHGTADTIVALSIHSAPLATRLPNAALTVIDGAGHMPHHSHPDLVIAAIDRAASRAGLR